MLNFSVHKYLSGYPIMHPVHRYLQLESYEFSEVSILGMILVRICDLSTKYGLFFTFRYASYEEVLFKYTPIYLTWTFLFNADNYPVRKINLSSTAVFIFLSTSARTWIVSADFFVCSPVDTVLIAVPLDFTCFWLSLWIFLIVWRDSYFICTEARIGAETWEKL